MPALLKHYSVPTWPPGSVIFLFQGIFVLSANKRVLDLNQFTSTCQLYQNLSLNYTFQIIHTFYWQEYLAKRVRGLNYHLCQTLSIFFFNEPFLFLMSRIKLILKILAALIFIIYSIGLNNIIIFLITTNVLYYKIIGLIILVLTIFYYFSSIILYILFSKNNISIPKNIPPFLNY